ncbi:MAG: T9SS type A sorting domain-containing protein, partial [Bacteroidia bacterium]
WRAPQVNGSDIKHVDTNGDGTINAADTVAIGQNFGFTHRSYKSGQSGPPLVLQAHNMAVVPSGGDTITLNLMWGTMDSTAQNMYGLTSTIYYDTSQIDEVKIQFANSWLGNPATNLLTMGRHESTAGRIDLGMVRYNRTNASGFGRIASIIMVIDDDISKRQVPLEMTFGDVYAVNVAGEEQGVGARLERLFVQTTSIDGPQLADEITVYPNPVEQGDVHIKLPRTHEGGQVSMLDMHGRVVAQQTINPSQQSTSFSMDNRASGVYFLRFGLGTRTASLKVILR